MSDDKTITLTLPVVIPAGLIPDGYEAVRAQIGFETRTSGESIAGQTYHEDHGGLRLIVQPKPTWHPPKSLKPGEYGWESDTLFYSAFRLRAIDASSLFRDWTDPPRDGIWRVNDDGTATYLGQSQ